MYYILAAETYCDCYLERDPAIGSLPPQHTTPSTNGMSKEIDAQSFGLCKNLALPDAQALLIPCSATFGFGADTWCDGFNLSRKKDVRLMSELLAALVTPDIAL